MKLPVKLILLVLLLSTSTGIFAQIPTDVPQKSTEADVKAYKEAKKQEEARMKAEEKRREEIKKMLEAQSKSESNQKKATESYTAAVHAKAESFYSAAIGQINVKHVNWIKENAKKINEKNLDDLSIKIMANFYGKNQGLGEADIEGLLVLLLQESYVMAKNDYRSSYNQLSENAKKKYSLTTVQRLLDDSSYIPDQQQLDSINLLIANNTTSDKKISIISPPSVTKVISPEAAPKNEMASRKMPESVTTVSNISLAKTKLAESIEELTKDNEEQNKRMQEISIRQQKITQMLSKMVNQVTDSQDKIIENLK